MVHQMPQMMIRRSRRKDIVFKNVLCIVTFIHFAQKYQHCDWYDDMVKSKSHNQTLLFRSSIRLKSFPVRNGKVQTLATKKAAEVQTAQITEQAAEPKNKERRKANTEGKGKVQLD